MTEILSSPEKEYEIVDGQPEEKVMGGARHGGVGMRFGSRLVVHVEANQLGGVYGPDTTFKIGNNQRLPDVSFVSASRIPEEGEPEGIWNLAPDLAVEIISPNDLFQKVISKVSEYFAAGVRQVWLISPEHKTVIKHLSATHATILSEADELTGDDLLPGFRCQVSELFQNPARVEKR
jgi:Uma2 family endonuclease